MDLNPGLPTFWFTTVLLSQSVHSVIKIVHSLYVFFLMQIEEEISKKYKGRRVNIMGEINAI